MSFDAAHRQNRNRFYVPRARPCGRILLNFACLCEEQTTMAETIPLRRFRRQLQQSFSTGN